MRQIQIPTHARLSDMVDVSSARAASLLLVDEGRYLLGVRPPRFDRGRYLLRLTGIGGWAEGEESFAETAVREAVEETGSAVRLLDLDQTLVIHSPEDMTMTGFSHDTAPAALVYRRFGTAPFDPWSSTFRSIAPIAVFAGILRNRPMPVTQDEIPLFMWVHAEQMIALADADQPLNYLLADGADLVGSADFDPAQAIVRLTDSIQALITALGPRSFSFLCDIARLTQPAHVE